MESDVELKRGATFFPMYQLKGFFIQFVLPDALNSRFRYTSLLNPAVQAKRLKSTRSGLTDQPMDSHGRNYEVVYHVRIPQPWQVSVENINGEVKIASIKSDVFVGLI